MTPIYRGSCWPLAGLLLLLFQSVSSYGQTKPPLTLDPDKKITQYMHDSWKVEDGLPQNSIRAITQTRDGYLWLGTEEGLVRFDGVTFDVFDKLREPSLRIRKVLALLEDHNGTLWIGTQGEGLIAYQAGQFTRYSTDDGLSSNDIMCLFEDQSGRLWIGTYEDGLNRYERGLFSAFQYGGDFSGGGVLAIDETSDGRLLVGTEKGLYQFFDDTFLSTALGVLSSESIKTIFEDSNGTIWTSTKERGTYKVHNDTITLLDWSINEGYVSAIHQDSEELIWVGSYGGGLIRIKETGEIDRYSAENGLSDDVVVSLYEDTEGSLWIGTRSGGLNRLRDSKFTTYTVDEGLAGNSVYPVIEDTNGGIWIGGDDGISMLSSGSVTGFSTENGLSSNMVLSLTEGTDGSLWIGTYDAGLSRLKNGHITHYTTDDGLPGNSIWVLHTDSQGNIWIGTGTNGICKYDGSRFHTLTSSHGLSSNDITSIFESQDGTIWIGTYNSGINRIQGRSITYLTTEDGLSDNAIQALYEDASGTFWIGTAEGGLNWYENGTTHSYSSKDGLFDDNIYVILEDDLGYLWMSSNRGIFRVHIDELNDFEDGKISRIRCDVFGTADGMKSAEANGGVQPAGWKSRDGRLWFPTTDGVAMISPNNIRFNTLPPPVSIKRMEVDNEVVSLDGEIVLDPGSDKLEIDYTALSLVAPEKVQFKYKLEGADDDWFDAGTRRTAYYTNLDPGAYTFHVIACNNDGVWNETGASLTFYLKPHFFQTIWFFGLVALLAIAAVVAGYRIRIQRHVARQHELEQHVLERTSDLIKTKEKTERFAEELEIAVKEKTMLLDIMGHDVKSGIVSMRNLAEIARPHDLPYEEFKNLINQSASDLLGLVTQLLHASQLEDISFRLDRRPLSLGSLVKEVVKTYQVRARQKNQQIHLELTGENLDTVFGDRDWIRSAIANLVTNAMKYSPNNTDITIATVADSKHVQLKISDKGPGITESDRKKLFQRFSRLTARPTAGEPTTGLGLYIVKKIAEAHGGDVYVRNHGTGATFVLEIPHADLSSFNT